MRFRRFRFMLLGSNDSCCEQMYNIHSFRQRFFGHKKVTICTRGYKKVSASGRTVCFIVSWNEKCGYRFLFPI